MKLKYSALFVSSLGAVVALVTTIVILEERERDHLQISRDDEEENLERLREALFASCLVSIPLSFETFFEFFTITSKNQLYHWLVRVVLLGNLAIPCVVLLGYISIEIVDFYLMYINAIATRYVISLAAVLFYFGNAYAHSSFRLKNSGLILLLAICGAGCSILSILFNNIRFRDSGASVFQVIFVACWGAVILLLSSSAVHWFNSSYQNLISDIKNDSSANHLCCIIYICSFFIELLAVILVVIFHTDDLSEFGTTNLYDLNSADAQVYIHLAFTVFTCGVAGRYARLESISKLADSKAKRTFVRFVSHEIRTPLNIISMGLDLLGSIIKQSDTLTEEEIERNNTIVDVQESCDKAMKVMNDLIAYEKLEKGVLHLDIKSIRAVTFFNTAIRSRLRRSKDLNFRFLFQLNNFPAVGSSFDESIMNNVFVNIDERKCALVIETLVSNAIRYSSAGGDIIFKIELVSRIAQSATHEPTRIHRKRDRVHNAARAIERRRFFSKREPNSTAAAMEGESNDVRPYAEGSSAKTTASTAAFTAAPATAGGGGGGSTSFGGAGGGTAFSLVKTRFIPSSTRQESADFQRTSPGATARMGSPPEVGAAGVGGAGSQSSEDSHSAPYFDAPRNLSWKEKLHRPLDHLPNMGSLRMSTGLGAGNQSQKQVKQETELKFSITDCGPGIAKEDYHKVFSEFGQFNPGELHGGDDPNDSGLGLFISKSVVELHGGSIGFSSEGRGKGCTFFITLPFERKAAKRAVGTMSLRQLLTETASFAASSSNLFTIHSAGSASSSALGSSTRGNSVSFSSTAMTAFRSKAMAQRRKMELVTGAFKKGSKRVHATSTAAADSRGVGGIGVGGEISCKSMLSDIESAGDEREMLRNNGEDIDGTMLDIDGDICAADVKGLQHVKSTRDYHLLGSDFETNKREEEQEQAQDNTQRVPQAPVAAGEKCTGRGKDEIEEKEKGEIDEQATYSSALTSTGSSSSRRTKYHTIPQRENSAEDPRVAADVRVEVMGGGAAVRDLLGNEPRTELRAGDDPKYLQSSKSGTRNGINKRGENNDQLEAAGFSGVMVAADGKIDGGLEISSVSSHSTGRIAPSMQPDAVAKAADQTVVEKDETNAMNPQQQQQQQPRQLRIMIVDDSALNRKMLERCLQQNDFAVDQLSDGDKAVEAVHAIMKTIRKFEYTHYALFQNYVAQQQQQLQQPVAELAISNSETLSAIRYADQADALFVRCRDAVHAAGGQLVLDGGRWKRAADPPVSARSHTGFGPSATSGVSSVFVSMRSNLFRGLTANLGRPTTRQISDRMSMSISNHDVQEELGSGNGGGGGGVPPAAAARESTGDISSSRGTRISYRGAVGEFFSNRNGVNSFAQDQQGAGQGAGDADTARAVEAKEAMRNRWNVPSFRRTGAVYAREEAGDAATITATTTNTTTATAAADGRATSSSLLASPEGSAATVEKSSITGRRAAASSRPTTAGSLSVSKAQLPSTANTLFTPAAAAGGGGLAEGKTSISASLEEEAALAVEALEAVTYEAILMDYTMVRMSGPAAAKAMREMGFRGIIIGVTGNALPSDMEYFVAQGVDAVLTKPLKLPIFLSELEAIKTQRAQQSRLERGKKITRKP